MAIVDPNFVPSPDQIRAFVIAQGRMNEFLRGEKDYAYTHPTDGKPLVHAVTLLAFMAATDFNMKLLTG